MGILKKLQKMMKKKKKDIFKPKFWRMQFYATLNVTHFGERLEWKQNVNRILSLPKLTKKEAIELIDLINKGREDNAKALTFKGKYCHAIINYNTFDMVKSYEL